MRLVQLTLNGYKRFSEPTKINLDSKLVCVIGSNEAGKTSILDGLMLFGGESVDKDEPVSEEDISHDVELASDAIIASARFRVDSSDLEGLISVPRSHRPRWFVVNKHVDGAFTFDAEPRPSRDLSPRASLAAHVERLRRLSTYRRLVAGSTTGDFDSDVADALAILRSTEETLSKQAIDRVRGVLSSPMLERMGATGQRVAARMDAWARHEAEPSPLAGALDSLWELCPDPILFRVPARVFDSEYRLTENDSRDQVLENIATLADLDLDALGKALNGNKLTIVERMLDIANANLDAALGDAWSQQHLRVRLRPNQGKLAILVVDEGDSYSRVTERSEGVKTFLALLAQTRMRVVPSREVILLVDEAETHLHYDAQADLIRMLGTQTAAAQVIYTTHSAGCLPDDLGRDVRVVRQRTDKLGTSEVLSSPWTEEPGIMALLLALGAGSMAFVPTRCAVFGEGPTEAILLPTLLRQAARVDSLGYQVAPGIAEIKPAFVKVLGTQGARVCYLVDGDAGGAANRKKLLKNGVPEELVIVLGGVASGLALEDVVIAEVYARAVTQQLHMSHGVTDGPVPRQMPRKARSSYVNTWCAKNGMPPPSKMAVAHGLVEIARDRDIVDPAFSEMLTNLHLAIVDVLQAGAYGG